PRDEHTLPRRYFPPPGSGVRPYPLGATNCGNRAPALRRSRRPDGARASRPTWSFRGGEHVDMPARAGISAVAPRTGGATARHSKSRTRHGSTSGGIDSARRVGYAPVSRMPYQLSAPASEGDPPAPPGVCNVARPDLHRTLYEVLRATASHRDLESLIRDLTCVLQRVAPFDVLRLVLHDPEHDLMRLHTLAGVHPVPTTPLEVPTSESPSGLAMQTQRSVVVADLEDEA